MATFVYNIPSLVLLSFVTFTIQPHHTACGPIKRSATDDCYGTECEVDLDNHDDIHNTQLLENITNSLVPALPEIILLLQNIAYTHQNTSITAYSTLPSIVSLLEEHNLHASRNQLTVNTTGQVTTSPAELVSLMKNQQELQEKQNQLLENTSTALQQMTYLLEQLASLVILPTDTVQIQQETPTPQQLTTIKVQPQPLHGCSICLSSGSYLISPSNDKLCSFRVYCDMETDGGGWIVFQRRFDGSVNFYLNWVDYENGFGNLEGEFWLGLKKLHILTRHGRWEVRFDLEDFDGNHAYAHYDNFRIGSSSSFYRLTLGTYSGTAGNSMRDHNLNGMAFTTKDQAHDLWTHSTSNCGINKRSGWWHNFCTNVNLNGLYLGETAKRTGMYWRSWKTYNSLKRSEMKIRSVDD